MNTSTEGAGLLSKFSTWCWCALGSLGCGVISLLIGIYKMTQYENSDYSWGQHTNAYVGGDAYNYIINGTHATALFVLAAMFCLGAIGFLILHYMDQSKKILEIAYSTAIKNHLAEQAEETAKRTAEADARWREEQERRRTAELEKQARITAYWEQHAEEKESLLAKKADAELGLSKLGKFDFKQRQALQDLIRSIETELTRDRKET